MRAPGGIVGTSGFDCNRARRSHRDRCYVQTTRRPGENLLAADDLESGCKIGMRAAMTNNVRRAAAAGSLRSRPSCETLARDDIWGGAPARIAGRCTELLRTASACRDRDPILAIGGLQRFDADRNVLCDQRGTRRRDPVACPRFHAGRRRRRIQQLL